MPNKLDHYLTYQHNVQRYFKSHIQNYDGVIIPLSIATSYPTGTYGFVRALCSKDKSKNYAIDPRSPLFQKSWNRDFVRPPHSKMADIFGEPFKTKGLQQALDPADFTDDAIIKNVTKSCLEFQNGFCAREEDAKKLKKYQKLLGIENLEQLPEPMYLIPPYFEFTNKDDPWYKIAFRFIDEAKNLMPEAEIRPVIHLKNWSSLDSWDEIAKELKNKNIKNYYLYPNDFREHKASEEELKAYRSAVESSVKNDGNPYALHGGYFTILTYYFGMKGFSNGIGYGEWRDSGYHKGGSANKRVYVPKLHCYLPTERAQHLLDIESKYFIEGCRLFEECVQEDIRLEERSQNELLSHFMECRAAEISFVKSNPLNIAINELATTLAALVEIGEIEFTEHSPSLTRWIKALK